MKSKNTLLFGLLLTAFVSSTSLTAQIPGSLDTTFANNGVAVTDFNGQSNRATAIALQPDGKILVAGTNTQNAQDDFYIVRYNTDGTLDASFGTLGVAWVDIAGNNDVCYGMALQADGKIILVGSTVTTNVAVRYASVTRLNSDGSIDTTFGTLGKYRSLTTDTFFRSVAVQSNGRIVLAGVSTGNPMTMRMLANGTLDNSFSGNGIDVQSLSGFSLRKVMITPAGKIIVCGGKSDSAGQTGGIIQYNADGTLDTSFNTTGYRSFTANFADVAMLSNGDLLFCGTYTSGGLYLYCLNPDGTNETTFGTNGRVIRFVYENVTEGNALSIQPDGKILVSGLTHSGGPVHTFVARFNTNGSVDSDFGTPSSPDGASTFEFGDNGSQANDMELQPDGKILLTGFQYTPVNGYDWLTLRINPGCPVTVPTGQSIQKFCFESYVSFLDAGGENIQWYATPTDGSPLSADTLLVNGMTYYAEAGNGICNSPSRLAVTVQVDVLNDELTMSNGVLTATQAGVTYVWINCNTGGIIPGATGRSYTPTQLGTYAAIVNAVGYSCSVTTNCIEITTLGTEVVDAAEKVSVAPNPVAHILYVSGVTEGASYRVVNVLGQQVLSGSLFKGQTDVESLLSGTYFIEINQNNRKLVKKFVKY